MTLGKRNRLSVKGIKKMRHCISETSRYKQSMCVHCIVSSNAAVLYPIVKGMIMGKLEFYILEETNIALASDTAFLVRNDASSSSHFYISLN